MSEPPTAPKAPDPEPARPDESAVPQAPAAEDPVPAEKTPGLDLLKSLAVPIVAALWAAIGTFWTIFAWYHQEVVVPAAAPVNLVTDVTVQEVGMNSRGGKGLAAVQVTVTANNVSTKTIHLLSNYWDAWAGTVAESAAEGNGDDWIARINAAQADQRKSGQPDYALPGRHYKLSGMDRVGWGNLFPTTYILHPKETISASALFYVPVDRYDMVHVEVHIPTTELPDVELMFVVDQKSVHPVLYRKREDGTTEEVRGEEDIDALAAKVQQTQAFREIVLQHSPGSASASAQPRPRGR